MIKHGSYREYQRYLCKDCDCTFNPKTGTTFAHAKIGLDKLLLGCYALLRFNTSIRQLDAELDVSYRSLRRRVEQFARTLDAPAIDLVGPVEIDECYVSAGLRGRERDQESRSCDLSKRGRGSFGEDKPPEVIKTDTKRSRSVGYASLAQTGNTLPVLLDCTPECIQCLFVISSNIEGTISPIDRSSFCRQQFCNRLFLFVWVKLY